MCGSESKFSGTIKFIDGAKGWGFISCEEVLSTYGRDVWVSQNLLEGHTVGDHVRFSMRVQSGKPQAKDLRPYEAQKPEQESEDTARTTALAERSGDIVHQGMVKKIDPERGFGFVACQATFDLYGSDVFVPARRISGFTAGDHVSFTVRLNKKGQPQATDLVPCEAEQEEREEGTMSGTIKSFDREHGYGFITSPEAKARFGRDVFLHLKQIKHFQPNDQVTFSVRINQGRPQAYELREATGALAWLAAGEAGLASCSASGSCSGPGLGQGSWSSSPKEQFVGELKSFSSSHGYGFIGCPELRESFGRDVFIHQSQAEGLTVGDRVCFRVQVKRGQPQACDVSPLDSQPQCEGQLAPAAALPVPGGSSGSTAPTAASREQRGDLDRQLLRACASARLESTGALAELLLSRADPNARDPTGHAALMVAALNARHSERKCRLLMESRADASALCHTGTTIIRWARERINPQFAEYLEGLKNGKNTDYTVALEIPRDID